ncbi:MAG: HAMP domain-containing sensor histidine kinase [Eubacteriales bacterium]|nr:HAMP domain-containing sensor histidine kinase [Eubacteriales bacterium]
MLAFLLIVGVSYYAVATSLIGLVGDSLFSDRRQQDTVAADRLAVEAAPLFASADMDALQQRLESASGELGGRLMVLDRYGKVQADSYSELNGARMELPEVASVLVQGASGDYGVHRLREGGRLLAFLRPYDATNEWVAYCTAALVSEGQTLGVLLFSSPIQDLMVRLYALQDQMAVYFVIAAVAAMGIALVISRVITKPIATLTRGIQRMGRGDLSVRVPVKGGGEMRRLAETFNAMSEKLETLDKSRNQFVSNASHELKTPLSTMKILLENIIYQPEMDVEVRTDFLTDINKEIDRLNLIISDLLTLVSMDAKTMRLNRETFSLAQVVEDNTHRLTPMAEQRHQEIRLQLSDDCEMYADCAKLTQVVYNLMDNAIKYTQEGGLIRVRLVRSGRDAILTVSDNGRGIPKEDRAHIFDRFYRVDKARSRETGGTGLGLAIVHQMVLMHGGSVSVESEEGHGSTFTVELPIHQG